METLATSPLSQLNAVSNCPLCGSGERDCHSTSSPNLYSEKLAALSGIEESALIDAVPNVQCRACALIYKLRWFPRSLLETLFRVAVPWHPKGWDAVSGRFTPDSFFTELDYFESALRTQDTEQAERWRRALLSIIDSIPALADHPERPAIDTAIERGDCDAVRERESLIRSTMEEPAAYKRFSGFSAGELWQYIDTTLGGLRSWAEVGCPLWGLLPRARASGVAVAYLHRPEANYWSAGCRNDGVHCTEYLTRAIGVPITEWSEEPSRPWDAIGAFQYLDHIENPGEFVAELFRRANAAAIILDAVDQPVAIQHFTGWTVQAIEWLANQHGCRVHSDFDEIRQSGNVLYLLEKG